METEIPNGWRQVALRSVCEPTRIWNPIREPRDEFWYVDVSAVSRESLAIQAPQRVKGAQAPSRARKIIKTGDAIFATVRPTLRRIAFVAQKFDNQIASTAFCIVRANRQEAVPRFLYYALQTNFFNEEVAKFQSGANYPAVNDKDILNQIIRVPPIPEQGKIAFTLWIIQRAIEIEAKLIATARELKQSAMLQLFTQGLRNENRKETDIGRIPKSWRVCPLSQIAKLERGRFMHRPRNEPRFYGGKTPFVQTGDVVRSEGWIRNHTQTLTDEGVAISRIFPRGTILITIAANIGYTGVLEYNCACPDSLIGITSGSEVDNWYLEYYLQTQQADMDRQAPKGTQKNINIQFLTPWPVVVPSLDEQKEIATILQTIDRKISVHERKRAALSDLFQTMLHQLMTAQIRVDKLDIDTSEVLP